MNAARRMYRIFSEGLIPSCAASSDPTKTNINIDSSRDDRTIESEETVFDLFPHLLHVQHLTVETLDRLVMIS